MSAPVLEDLLAHRAPMLLLDRVVSVDAGKAVAEVTVRRDNPLVMPGRGLPAYVGIELMAQTIGLIDGLKCYDSGEPAKLGFLLGCRRYHADVTEFPIGTRLLITTLMVFNGGEMYSFECHIGDADGRDLAHANLNVFAPRNPEQFLKDGTV